MVQLSRWVSSDLWEEVLGCSSFCFPAVASWMVRAITLNWYWRLTQPHHWQMMHVWDHYDYGLASLSWWKTHQGYLLIKVIIMGPKCGSYVTDWWFLLLPFQGIAEFWLQNLLEDDYFKDGTLVIVPCNSPEQVPITFGVLAASWQNHFTSYCPCNPGCAHWQQLIWELFNYVLKGHSDAGEMDMKFIEGTL